MRRLFLVLALLAPAVQASAATYYIDPTLGLDSRSAVQAQSKTTPWAHVPGMNTATSTASTYTVLAGDTFVLKGGETWSLSGNTAWTLRAGTSGSPVVYTADETWFTGASFAKPIIDGSHSAPASATGLITGTNLTGLTLNDLHVTNVGTANTATTTRAFVLENCSYVTITNNLFDPYTWAVMLITASSTGTYTNYVLHNNEWTNTTAAIWWTTQAPNMFFDTVDWYQDWVHDGTSMIGGGVHGDGFLHWISQDATGVYSQQHISNFFFYRNRFSGDWRRSFGVDGAMTTAFFMEGAAQIVVCNNIFELNQGGSGTFESLVGIGGSIGTGGAGTGKKIELYWNTIAQTTGIQSASSLILRQGDSGGTDNPTVIAKNNIVAGSIYPGLGVFDNQSDHTGWTSDYNYVQNDNSNMGWGIDTFQSFTNWLLHDDTHSVLSTSAPGFVVAGSDYHLTAGSAAKDAGVDLSGLGYTKCNADYEGTTRTTTAGTVDIGAYAYPAGVGGGTPAPQRFRFLRGIPGFMLFLPLMAFGLAVRLGRKGVR